MYPLSYRAIDLPILIYFVAFFHEWILSIFISVISVAPRWSYDCIIIIEAVVKIIYKWITSILLNLFFKSNLMKNKQ